MTTLPTYQIRCIDHLVPYARNSRTHSDEQVDKIAASIREFGFLNPVIVDGDNGIIAGHGRVLAAQKLGLAEVPCLEASHLTDAQRRAYIIADNRLALDGGWDDEMLRLEFAELGGMDFDIDLTGFSTDDLTKIFDETGGVIFHEEKQEKLTAEIIVRFALGDRVKIMNAVNAAISGISGAVIWCDHE